MASASRVGCGVGSGAEAPAEPFLNLGLCRLPLSDIQRRGLPLEAFRPILPSPRHVPADEIEGDRFGLPLLERRLFLLDPPWPQSEIRER